MRSMCQPCTSRPLHAYTQHQSRNFDLSIIKCMRFDADHIWTGQTRKEHNPFQDDLLHLSDSSPAAFGLGSPIVSPDLLHTAQQRSSLHELRHLEKFPTVMHCNRLSTSEACGMPDHNILDSACSSAQFLIEIGSYEAKRFVWLSEDAHGNKDR